MTAEIIVIVEAGVQLAIKILELAQAASKGDLTAAETLKAITENDAAMKAVADKARAYVDEKFDGGK